MVKMRASNVLESYRNGNRDFRRINLRGENFSGRDLSGADFSEADIRGATFEKARLTDTRFRNAKMGAPFIWTIGSRLIATVMSILISSLPIWAGLLISYLFILHIRSSIGLAPGLLSALVYISLLIIIVKQGAGPVAGPSTTIFATVLAVAIFVMAISSETKFITQSVAFALRIAVNGSTKSAAVAVTLMAAGAAAAYLCAVLVMAMAVTIAVAPISAIIGSLVVNSAILISLGATRAISWPAALWLAFAMSMINIIVSALIARRALHSDPRDALVRDFALRLISVAGTRFGGAEFICADFSGAYMKGTDYRDALFDRVSFNGALDFSFAFFGQGLLISSAARQLGVSGRGQGGSFIRANFQGIAIHNANLKQADLREANFQDSDLCNADLADANLIGSNLRRCNLKGASFDGARLEHARIDVLTYKRSEWTPDLLEQLRDRGVEIVDLDTFPEAAQNALLGNQEGLTLYFQTTLTPIDHYLIAGIIIGVLGKDTDCRVAAYQEKGVAAIVRLVASRRADLERVAEALYLRVWETQMRMERQLLKAADVIGTRFYRDGLSNLRERLDQIALREVPSQKSKDASRAQRRDLARSVWTVDASSSHHLPSSTEQCSARLFLCYSRKDDELRRQLFSHLAALRNQGLIETWYDGEILPGEVWDEEIRQRLEEADVIVLLLTSDFLSSDYCNTVEVPRALARHREGTAHVVPVLARAVEWTNSPLSQLQALPDNLLSVASWSNRDEAWANVAAGIRRVVEKLGKSGRNAG